MRISVKNLLRSGEARESVKLGGWVRTKRDSKAFSFVEINDGSCLQGIQVIIDEGIPGWDSVSKMTTGASVEVRGELVESPGKGQSWEVRAGRSGPRRCPCWGKRRKIFRFRRKGIPRNFCARLPICVRGPISMERPSGCGAGWLMPCIAFLMNGILHTSTRRSLRRAIVKGRGKCFR